MVNAMINRFAFSAVIGNSFNRSGPISILPRGDTFNDGFIASIDRAFIVVLKISAALYHLLALGALKKDLMFVCIGNGNASDQIRLCATSAIANFPLFGNISCNIKLHYLFSFQRFPDSKH
jgi:hypothetical protein